MFIPCSFYVHSMFILCSLLMKQLLSVLQGTTVSMDDTDDEDDYDEEEASNFEEMLARLQSGGVKFA